MKYISYIAYMKLMKCTLFRSIAITFVSCRTQTFSIDCVVSGLPEPSVAWVKLKSRFPANAERYAAAPGVFRLRFHKVSKRQSQKMLRCFSAATRACWCKNLRSESPQWQKRWTGSRDLVCGRLLRAPSVWISPLFVPLRVLNGFAVLPWKL